jgi:hypothetical protein
MELHVCEHVVLNFFTREITGLFAGGIKFFDTCCLKSVHVDIYSTRGITCVQTWIFIFAHLRLHVLLHFCTRVFSFFHPLNFTCVQTKIFIHTHTPEVTRRFTFLQTWNYTCAHVELNFCTRVFSFFHLWNFTVCKRKFSYIHTRLFTFLQTWNYTCAHVELNFSTRVITVFTRGLAFFTRVDLIFAHFKLHV